MLLTHIAGLHEPNDSQIRSTMCKGILGRHGEPREFPTPLIFVHFSCLFLVGPALTRKRLQGHGSRKACVA